MFERSSPFSTIEADNMVSSGYLKTTPMILCHRLGRLGLIGTEAQITGSKQTAT